ncbi:MAG: hypothetical protein EBY09_14920 [Verrucomicrobia bacterium]|nr:hypothetical protein [Verrucomicrobiota bacterium]
MPESREAEIVNVGSAPVTIVKDGGVRVFYPKAQAAIAQLSAVTVEDLDQLWDWARSDRDGVSSFLNAHYPNSQAFFNRMAAVLADEQNGTAYLRSVRDANALVGFVMFSPIVQKSATVHLYLTPNTPTKVLSDVIDSLPRDMGLMLVAPTDEFAAKFADYGFQSKIVLTRPASASTGDSRAD